MNKFEFKIKTPEFTRSDYLEESEFTLRSGIISLDMILSRYGSEFEIEEFRVSNSLHDMGAVYTFELGNQVTVSVYY